MIDVSKFEFVSTRRTEPTSQYCRVEVSNGLRKRITVIDAAGIVCHHRPNERGTSREVVIRIMYKFDKWSEPFATGDEEVYHELSVKLDAARKAREEVTIEFKVGEKDLREGVVRIPFLNMHIALEDAELELSRASEQLDAIKEVLSKQTSTIGTYVHIGGGDAVMYGITLEGNIIQSNRVEVDGFPDGYYIYVIDEEGKGSLARSYAFYTCDLEEACVVRRRRTGNGNENAFSVSIRELLTIKDHVENTVMEIITLKQALNTSLASGIKIKTKADAGSTQSVAATIKAAHAAATALA